MESGVRDSSSMKRSKKSKKSTPSSIRRSTRIKTIPQSPLNIPANRMPSPSPVTDDKNSSGNSCSSSSTSVSSHTPMSDESASKTYVSKDISAADIRTESKYCGDLVRRKILEADADNAKETYVHSRKLLMKRRTMTETTAAPAKHSQQKDKMVTKTSRKRKNKKDDHDQQDTCIKKTMNHSAVMFDSSEGEGSNHNNKMTMCSSIDKNIDPNSKHQYNGILPKEEGNPKQINLNKQNVKTAGGLRNSIDNTSFELSEEKILLVKETNGENNSYLLNERTQLNGLEAKNITKTSEQCHLVGQKNKGKCESHDVAQKVYSNDMAHKNQEENSISELNIQNPGGKQQVDVKKSQLSSPNNSSEDSLLDSKPVSRKLKPSAFPAKIHYNKKKQSKLSPRKKICHTKKLNKIKHDEYEEIQLAENCSCLPQVISSDNVHGLTSVKQFCKNENENETEHDSSQKSPNSVDLDLSDLNNRIGLQVKDLVVSSQSSKIRSPRKISHSKNSNSKTRGSSANLSSNVNFVKTNNPDKDQKYAEFKTLKYKNKTFKMNLSKTCPIPKEEPFLFENKKSKNSCVLNSSTVNSVPGITKASGIDENNSANNLDKYEKEINNGSSSDEKDLKPELSNYNDNKMRKANELYSPNLKLNEDEDILGSSDSDESLAFRTMKSKKYTMQNFLCSSPSGHKITEEAKDHTELEENKKIKIRPEKNKSLFSKCKRSANSRIKRSLNIRSTSSIVNQRLNKIHKNYYLKKKTLQKCKNNPKQLKSYKYDGSDDSKFIELVDSKENPALANSMRENQNKDVKSSGIENASTSNINIPLNIESTDLELRTETTKTSMIETVSSHDKRNWNEKTCSKAEPLRCEKNALGNDKAMNNNGCTFLQTLISNGNSCKQFVELQNTTITESCNSNRCVEIENTIHESISGQADNEYNFDCQEKEVIVERKQKSTSFEIEDEKSNCNNTFEIDRDFQHDVEIPNDGDDELIFSDNDDKLSISPQFSPDENVASDSSITKPSDKFKEVSHSTPLEYSGINLNESFSCDESEFLDKGYSPCLTDSVFGDKEEIYERSCNEDSQSENETEFQFSMKRKPLEIEGRDFNNEKMKFMRKRRLFDSQVDNIHYKNVKKDNKPRKYKQKLSISSKEESPARSSEKETELLPNKSSDL